MNIVNLKKKAICIENANQERRFIHFCNKINIFEPRKNSSLLYPYYMTIVETNAGVYAVPNQILEGEEDAVIELGFFPVSMKQFERYLKEREMSENEKVDG